MFTIVTVVPMNSSGEAATTKAADNNIPTPIIAGISTFFVQVFLKMLQFPFVDEGVKF
jgi:hypothetical protein